MTIRLHKYIEGLGTGNTLVNVHIDDDEMRTYVDFLRKHGPNAMCFDLGDIMDYDGMKCIPELCRNTPYETCFYQFHVNSNGKHVVSSVLEKLYQDRDMREYVILRDEGGETHIRCGVVEYADGKVAVHPPEERDYGITIFQAMRCFKSILNCKNIGLEKVEPDAALQKARAKRGKMPLFSYHVLDINPDTSELRKPGGGTHASPRFHLRRGHIRRFSDGTYTWVQACGVGDKKLGMVHKDYRFQAASN